MLPSKLRTRRALLATLLPVAFTQTERIKANHCTRMCKKGKSSLRRLRCKDRCQQKEQERLAPQPQQVEIGGAGPQVTELFFLAAGRYLATTAFIAVETDNFIITIHGPDGPGDLIVNEIPKAPGRYLYKSIIYADESGMHLLEAEHAAGAWGVVLTPY